MNRSAALQLEPFGYNHLAERLFLAPIFFPSHYSPQVEDPCFRSTPKDPNDFKSTIVFKLDLNKENIVPSIDGISDQPKWALLLYGHPAQRGRLYCIDV